MDEKMELMNNDIRISNLIYNVRGKQVMLDSDLAMLYQVETKNHNKAMKRNQKRFPEEFCFQLTEGEFDNLRFQFGTSSANDNYGGRRYMPHVYTEQGIAMLSAVLRSEVAIAVSIRIMKTFVEMRRYVADSRFVMNKIEHLETKQIELDLQRQRFEEKTDERFEQIFDAFYLLTELIGRANESIVLIDGYVDVSTLNILAKKKGQVEVVVYTYPSARITKMDVDRFNSQYPMLELKKSTAFHDRFLIIDGTEGYHIGASIKDAGKKCFGINQIKDINILREILERLTLEMEEADA